MGKKEGRKRAGAPFLSHKGPFCTAAVMAIENEPGSLINDLFEKHKKHFLARLLFDGRSWVCSRPLGSDLHPGKDVGGQTFRVWPPLLVAGKVRIPFPFPNSQPRRPAIRAPLTSHATTDHCSPLQSEGLRTDIYSWTGEEGARA